MRQKAVRGRGILHSDISQQAGTKCGDPNCKLEGCRKSRKASEEDEETDLDAPEPLEFKAFDFGAEILTAGEINFKPENLNDLAKTVEAVFGITQERLMLLFPSLLPAFGLKSKKWRYVCSDDMRDVVWGKDAFQSLQLKPATKKLVRSLVEGHKDSVMTGFDDVVTGKGQGLIFLLHG